MASNLSSIGFHFGNAEEFETMMTALASAAEDRVSCEPGDYLLWRSPTGAELWFHLPLFGNEDVSADIAGLTPFFSGDSTIDLKVTERLHRPGDNAFEGAYTAWVSPDSDTGEGSYPLVFEAVDYAAHAGRALPINCRARITGFARKVRVFADEAAFLATHNEADRAPLAAQAFIPVGLFACSMQDESEAGRNEPQQPSASALLTGRVIKHLELTNGQTDRRYHWLVVASLDATYDIVADPEVLEGEPIEGGIVEVACTLFGRLLD